MGPAGGEPHPRLFELCSPEIVLDMSNRTLNPDVYEGHEGMRRLSREVGEVWQRFEIVPERFIEVGDERVVVIETVRGRSHAGIDVEDRTASEWILRGGQIVRMETNLDPQRFSQE